MNYARIYSDLIHQATHNLATFTERHHIIPRSLGGTERHHIIPRSLGGTDDLTNIIHLSIREHYLAHLLLFKIGHHNQIFSVERFLQDSLNPRSRRYKLLRYKRWLRRAINRQKVINLKPHFTEGPPLNLKPHFTEGPPLNLKPHFTEGPPLKKPSKTTVYHAGFYHIFHRGIY